jgi:hypothetical protein
MNLKYIHRWRGTDKYMRLRSSVAHHRRIYWGVGLGPGSDVWPYVHIFVYGVPGPPPWLTRDPYSRRLTDEYRIFMFFTNAYFGCLPGRGASKTSRIYIIAYNMQNIHHSIQQQDIQYSSQ